MTEDRKPRQPQVFTPDAPGLEMTADPPPRSRGEAPPNESMTEGPLVPRVDRDIAARGFRWGALLLATGGALASIALALSFARFVSIAVERNDWIGWTATGLLALMALSAVILIGREIAGFFRLRSARRRARRCRARDPRR